MKTTTVVTLLIATATVHGFTSTTQRFVFPNIPMDMGIRHIHTPEMFASSHKLCFPQFELLHVSEPYTTGSHTTIHFRFRSLFGEKTAHMFTNNKCISHIIVFDFNTKIHVATTFAVTTEGVFGHRLSVQSQILTPGTQYDNINGFGPVVLSQEHVADAIREGYHSHDEEEHLLTYRRMVLFGFNK